MSCAKGDRIYFDNKFALPCIHSMSQSSPQPPQPPNLPEQIAQVIIKYAGLLIGLTAAGTGVYYLTVSKVLEAAIALLLSVFSTLLSSFGESLMKVLKEWMSNRGEQAGKTITQKADRVLDRPSGFQQQYLEAIKTHCYALEVEGFRGNLPRLPLKEIFVPLRLDSAPDSTLKRQLIKEIWDLLPKDNNTNSQPLNPRLAIVADPGYGKTTLTRYLTLSYADSSYRHQKAKELIPILLLFRTIHSQIQNDRTPTLPDLIIQQIKLLPRCQDLQPSPQWLISWLKNGKCLVMLDGLDEVPSTQREKVSKWANWQMRAYDTPFILTSRPHGYDSTLFQGVEPVKIEDFTNDQKSNFIIKWYQSRIWEQWKYLYEQSQQNLEEERLSFESAKAQSQQEAQTAADDLKRQLFANQALNELAKNPLLVTIIAATHEVLESLPKERISLYRKILYLLLENRPIRRATRLTIANAEDNQIVLQKLALQLVEQRETQFTPQQASPWIETRLSEYSPDSTLTPDKFLREIQTIAGLLAGGTEDGGLYQFTHKTFQEYLAAVELQQQGQEQLLIEQFYNPDWEEVICFYATLTSATPFLQLVLDNPPENYQDQKYALKLALRLVEEGGKVDEQMRQRLDRALEQTDLGDELNAAIRLEQKFRNLTTIDEKTAISEPITWCEYQLFLEAQASGQFHSNAAILSISPEQENQPVTGIDRQDASWFCGWLSTQANLQSEGILYDYRLPSDEENSRAASQRITLNSTRDSDFLRVVRETIPNRYRALLNYLAAGRWREADEETDKVMLEVAGQEERGYLMPEDIDEFPCEDLLIIDRLWLKFSGDRFGFSVQKKIYEELGGTYVYNEEVWESFGVRVGWLEGENWMNYDELTFNLNASQAHLPGFRRIGGFSTSFGSFFGRSRMVGAISSLVQRLVTCKI